MAFDIGGVSQYTRENFFARFGLINGFNIGPLLSFLKVVLELHHGNILM